MAYRVVEFGIVKNGAGPFPMKMYENWDKSGFLLGRSLVPNPPDGSETVTTPIFQDEGLFTERLSEKLDNAIYRDPSGRLGCSTIRIVEYEEFAERPAVNVFDVHVYKIQSDTPQKIEDFFDDPGTTQEPPPAPEQVDAAFSEEPNPVDELGKALLTAGDHLLDVVKRLIEVRAALLK